MHLCLASIVLAAHPTTLEKLRRIPTETWISVAIFLVGVIVIVKAWRTLRHINDYAPYLACCVAACCVFFYWVYSRTEPAFLTPVVERLVPFFPTKSIQQQNIEQSKRAREG